MSMRLPTLPSMRCIWDLSGQIAVPFVQAESEL